MAFGNKINKDDPISEINVTPLVDVMLVLLIIFMVTAPLMLNGISLELPKTKENNSVTLENKMVVLSFTKEMKLFIEKEEVKFSQLGEKLGQILKKNEQEFVYLRADKEIKYGSVARLMSYLKSEGFTKISLITDIETSKSN